MLKLIEKTQDSEIISLFIPGFPGGYKERDLFSDMRKFSSDIYTVVYPGTDGVKGILSPKSAVSCVVQAIEELQKIGKKILLFAYSFGSLQIISSTIDSQNIIGLFLFSPIIDLKHCLTHSFTEQLATLDNTIFTINTKSFESKDLDIHNAWKSYEKKLDKWLSLGIPTIFAQGLLDEGVFQVKINELLQQKLNNSAKPLYFVYTCIGSHKLDSIYKPREVLYDMICTFLITTTIEKSLKKKIVSSIMGSTLNPIFRTHKSDVDLMLFAEEFTVDDLFTIGEINKKFLTNYGTKFDISINTFSELTQKRQIRSNRGKVFIAELYSIFFFFSSNGVLELPKQKITWLKVKQDILNSNKINVYQAKKAILNPGSLRFHTQSILKIYVQTLIYHAYLENSRVINFNLIKMFYKKNKLIYELLENAITIKISDSELKNDELKLMISQCENLLNIEKNYE
jgi:hypothetical protein